MQSISKQIKKELLQHVDPIYKKGSARFFKHEVAILGVRVGIVRSISRKYYTQIKHLHKKGIFKLAEELLREPYQEFSIIAFSWIGARHKEFTPSDFAFFKKIIEKHVTNWARCDDFCAHSMGILLEMYPELVSKIKTWTRSKNLWVRRAAAVSFIYPARKGIYLKDIFEIADALLMDKEDMVQKGYGWMLKDASVAAPAKVYKFVMDRKDNMPRTALRYAIERFPKEMKMAAMK